MSAAPAANELGLVAAAAAIRAGRLRSVELVDACLSRIEAREKLIGAWTCVDADAVRRAAMACDREPATGLLHGVPLGVKDMIDTADLPTELGSPIHRGRRPHRDAACVARAKQAGAIVLGKTVTTELAYFAPGKTANPRHPDHTPGGSSSGSAAAVADWMVPAAFGTQTAASVIRPASFCGTVGVKPSRGWFDLGGITPFAPSFDTLGLIARSVADVRCLRAALLDVPFTAESPIVSPRVGVCRTPWWLQADDDCHVAVEAAASTLARAGASVREVALPASLADLPALHRAIMAREAAASYRQFYDEHGDCLSAPLRALVEEGSGIDDDSYARMRTQAAAARAVFAEWMRSIDVLVTPSAKGEAPRGLAATGDPLFSRAWMVLDAPTLTLPGFVGSHGLPVGVQIVGAAGDDERTLAVAQWAEAAILDASAHRSSGQAR